MTDSAFSVLTLNISRPPKDRAAALLEYLWHREDDILVLTETGRGEGSALIESVCRAAGHDVHSSLRGVADRGLIERGSTERGALGVLVVARNGFTLVPDDIPALPLLPERLMACRLTPSSGPRVRLLAAYGAASDPVRYANAAQRQRKRDWLNGFVATLQDLPPTPTLIAGDLNIVAPGHRDRLPYVLSEERAAYDTLTTDLGLTDVYAAAHHGTDLAGDPTWVDHSGVGCRYDYLLTGGGVTGSGVVIDQTPRTSRLTDHAALSASFTAYDPGL
ncbi:MAG: endonuclease/exonuclease/phosphatase family protein [Tetrasphaera jenkinsii]|uniref:Endonuclease/exonuclease/phosphatase domain-containing protein n=1 Tax=Nostocoides jenkinsii Ben 74 TaxID=1193518 RepID=A0A077MER1_9MICO|nr:endonuclease/exonuclease/phosphatase family protein [Tetrasphaera jenkinsii]MCI1262162.1 endonuclease/exonuclease/phosphatase family protein [Tetrasphaera jenkinsii]CCI54495.1 conserved hypothetical protein [Tetrasphaera jenkinsii Ben 74]